MRTKFTVLTVLLVALSAVAATPLAAGATQQSGAQCSFPVSVTDATGTEVTLDEKPQRVTTLMPSATQIMWEIGGKEQVVGVGLPEYSTYLDGVESRTNVSAEGMGVSVEKIVGTDPDLVLAPSGTPQETVEALREAGLTVYVYSDTTSVEDVKRDTTVTGKLTGNCEGAAEANAWMVANVDAAANATADAERPRVIYPLGGGYVAGGETFIDSVISASGGTNVVAEAGLTGYPQLNDEKVIELEPEVIVVSDYPGPSVVRSEPYASTPAGENNRTVTVDRNWINQPAPRSVVYATRNLTAGLHPEAAESADFVAKSEIRAEANASADGGTGSDGGQSATDASGDANADADADAEGETGAQLPGFGVPAAVAALLASALLARRRR
ncbi:PGF-CTERM-anchored ABC transporter substrate-binding protein [Halegenticoccus soli]|uniref:PGF-CTERM-anchored ABC transporter substrate-binding protein n=1 Tax=Halegenticoccus soli TaxID=1985678 RepID=UPI000C6CB295|nr:PGF-CTERM-anchored ABC transporter substrate-binding protein [Halegenticoccus soli]